MKKNFKLKVKLMKSQKWSLIKSFHGDYFIKWVTSKGCRGSRIIDAQAVNIMTFDQLSRFLGY